MVTKTKQIILDESLDKNIEALTQRAITLYSKNENNTQRLIISVAGVPGSGKSTVTEKVCRNLNRILCLLIAVVLPQDGFHYYRSQLLAMKDSSELIKRRGAPFTFNSSRLLQLVKDVKSQVDYTLRGPSFNHNLKDPKENSIEISPLIKIVLLEGNYVHLKDEAWGAIQTLSDERWFVLASFDTIKERLVQRHMNAGICTTVEEAVNRVENNDLLNAKYIMDHSVQPDVVVLNT